MSAPGELVEVWLARSPGHPPMSVGTAVVIDVVDGRALLRWDDGSMGMRVPLSALRPSPYPSARIPCAVCDRMVPTLDAHELHLSTCPVHVAALDGREPSDDDHDECQCDDVLVCAACCETCNPERN